MNKKKEGIKSKDLVIKIIYGFLIISFPSFFFNGEYAGSSAYFEIIFWILSFWILFSILVLTILGCVFTSNNYFERVVNGSIQGFYGLLCLTVSFIASTILDYLYYPTHFYYEAGIVKTIINSLPNLFIILVSCLIAVIVISFVVSLVYYLICQFKTKKKK